LILLQGQSSHQIFNCANRIVVSEFLLLLVVNTMIVYSYLYDELDNTINPWNNFPTLSVCDHNPPTLLTCRRMDKQLSHGNTALCVASYHGKI